MKVELLEELYKRKLDELLDAERQLMRCLPRMAKAIADEGLRERLQEQLGETEVRCERLELLIATRGRRRAKSKLISGILAESNKLLKEQESGDPEILTLVLMMAMQDVEGRKITGYACAHAYARLLGFEKDLAVLKRTFEEETQMEADLFALAEGLVFDSAEEGVFVEPPHLGGA